MANLCREAAYGPVREAAETIEHITAEEVRIYSTWGVVCCVTGLSVCVLDASSKLQGF